MYLYVLHTYIFVWYVFNAALFVCFFGFRNHFFSTLAANQMYNFLLSFTRFCCCGCGFSSEHFSIDAATAGYFKFYTETDVNKNVQMCENMCSAIVAHNNQMFALEIEVDPYGSRRLSSEDTLIIDSLSPFLTIFQYYLLHLNCYLVLAAAAAVLVYSIFELNSR